MNRSDIVETYHEVMLASASSQPDMTSNAGMTRTSSNLTQAKTHANSAKICQICGIQLKLDASVQNITEATYRQLSTPFSSRDDVDETTISGNVDTDMEMSMNAVVTSGGEVGDCGADSSCDGGGGSGVADELDLINSKTSMFEPLCRKSMAPRSFYLCPANIVDSSNQLLSQISQPNSNELMTGWSTRINATSALFDLMSSNTHIDHPLCEECADQLVNQLDVQCKLIEKEHADYTSLIGKLNQQAAAESDQVATLQLQLDQLENEEKTLLAEIEAAEKRENELIEEKKLKQAEERNLLQREQVTSLEYSNLKRQIIRQEEKQESLDNQIRNTELHLARLRSVNVLNATFHIWHSGPFGTINYFRLGRLPDTPVEWDEINAGLGQVNLLLYCLAHKIGLKFNYFRLVPNGNYSYIEVIQNYTIQNNTFKAGDELQMHRLKGLRYYFEWDSKFDQAMIAFLDCLQQFENKIKSLDAQFTMPYRINGYKLEDKHTSSSFSIKCQFNSFEEWTKALKYMLTNLKWSLTWVTSNDTETKALATNSSTIDPSSVPSSNSNVTNS